MARPKKTEYATKATAEGRNDFGYNDEPQGPTICKACQYWDDQSYAHGTHEWDKCRANNFKLDFITGEEKPVDTFCKNKNDGNCPDFEKA